MLIDTPTGKASEYKRLKKLHDFDLDYNSLQEEFEDLLSLAASIAGTEYSLLNLIDNYTQWTVSAHGLETGQMDREKSVCYHTIQKYEPLEISRLDRDLRFMERDYVKMGEFKYYLGIPLTLETGENLGALCMIGKQGQTLPAETIAQLKLITSEVIKRLELKIKIGNIEVEVEQNRSHKHQLAHDIRSPLSGIIGLCELVSASEELVTHEELTTFLIMINRSANRIMDLTKEILDQKEFEDKEVLGCNLEEFQNKLKELYKLPAEHKNIDLQFESHPAFSDLRFSKKILLSAAGNLISNAIKFTPSGGKISIITEVTKKPEDVKTLEITVQDNGPGIPPAVLAQIEAKDKGISFGTEGEKGYGLGLHLVNEMIKCRNGRLIFESPEKGSRIKLEFPI